jgi:hypothetical protein
MVIRRKERHNSFRVHFADTQEAVEDRRGSTPIGLPSHACQVMEWGFDGVLVNTAVSCAVDPVQMAAAFANGVQAGRAAFLAGPMTPREAAVPSTPEIGRPFALTSSLAGDRG